MFNMQIWPRWSGARPGCARGTPGSLHLGGQIKLGRKDNIDVRDAHGLPQHFGYVSTCSSSTP